MSTLNGRVWLHFNPCEKFPWSDLGDLLINASPKRDGVGLVLVLTEREEAVLSAVADTRGFGNSSGSVAKMLSHMMKRTLAGESKDVDSFTYDYIISTRTFSTHRPNPKVRQFDASGMNELPAAEKAVTSD